MPIHKPVKFHILPGPIEIRIRKIDTSRELRLGRCSVYAYRARIGKEIEKALALNELGNQSPRIAMVQK